MLKHEGPSQVLAEMTALGGQQPQVEEPGKQVTYLQEREQPMQYPHSQDQGRPIARAPLKTPINASCRRLLREHACIGPIHVNPMPALRAAERNERWSEAWQQSSEHRRSQRIQHRISASSSVPSNSYKRCNVSFCFGGSAHKTKSSKPRRASCALEHAGPARPASDHTGRPLYLQ
jgi:hypothetical protein